MSSTKELLAEHNKRAKAAGKPTLASWKGSKDKLQERIDALPAVKALEPKAKAPNPELEAKYRAAIERASINPADPIATASEKLLTAVAFEHDKRKWGIPYSHILAEVQRVFPDANTTVACLRWYAVALNKDGVILHHRKRSVS